MNKWFKRFFEEKEIDMEEIFEVEGSSGLNLIPAGVVVEHILVAPAHEQAKIKNILVEIDFKNASVTRFLKHLAGAIAA